MASSSELRAILRRVAAGDLGAEEAADRISAELEAAEADLDFARLDLGREARTGAPEAVFAEGKDDGHLVEIVDELVSRQGRVLVTRVDAERAELLSGRHPDGTYDPLARLWSLGRADGAAVPGPVAAGGSTGADSGAASRTSPTVAVVSAGTADARVFAEAAGVAEWMGAEVRRHADVGVAGLHRLLRRLDEIRRSRVVIAVAGMDGALPTVLAGLVEAPVIAVPTSVGYGAGAGGITPLLTMLGSCAPGLAVVNIDNGYGAAVLALRILRSS